MVDRSKTAGAVVLPRRRTTWEQWCKNYDGMAECDKCKAGVEYASVRLEHAPIKYRRCDSRYYYTVTVSYPCFKDRNLGGATCDHACFPTEEEIAAHHAELDAMFRRNRQALEAIQKHLRMKGITDVQSYDGAIECPVCGSRLRFSRSAYNGHIHAQCNGDDCVAFMQ